MATGGGGGRRRRAGLSGFCWKTCCVTALIWAVSAGGRQSLVREGRAEWTATSAAKMWLRNYGYLQSQDNQTSDLQQEKTMQSALAAMQRFYGIPVTGILDETTMQWMWTPRCGVPDQPHTSRRQRNKRYALTGQKWREKKISYSISNYTPKVGQKDTQRAIRRAFSVWQTVTPLSFQEVPYSEIKKEGKEADIMIFFASGFHGDSSPFDGEGGFLAHAYFPGAGIGGDTHFDSDEPWTLGNPSNDGYGGSSLSKDLQTSLSLATSSSSSGGTPSCSQAS